MREMYKDMPRATVRENPMLRFGPCPEPGKTCNDCKHLSGYGGRFPHPECKVRGKKAHDPEWPACSQFQTCGQWRAQENAKRAASMGEQEVANIGYFGGGGM
jgi:hypothetical protein